MQAYVAQIIYKIKSSAKGIEQYDEQYRLLFAEDERMALNKAQILGKEEEAAFIDRHGRAVSWELVAIKDLQEVQLDHGSLLFSTVKEVEPIAAPLWAESISC
jgi:hypothetical protein